MEPYQAQLVPAGQLGPMWCDVCGESKHAAFWLMPLTAQPVSDRDAERRALCEGWAEGLEGGTVITEADLEQRRQRRRGSHEP